MPFYEYRPKSGSCEICNGRFMDLQSMAEDAHRNCPECGKPCERILSAPMVSVRGAEYRASENAEKRAQSTARANVELDRLRAEAERRVVGHSHNCVAAGCFGAEARDRYLGQNSSQAVAEQAQQLEDAKIDSGKTVGQGDRIQGMPYLVGKPAPQK